MKRLMLAALAALGLCGHAAAQDRFDLQAMSRAELTAFTRAMPKGGDIHIHLSGAPYPETYLQWAAEDGLCVDLVQLALTDTCTPGGDLVLASALTPDQRAAMMDSLSTRRPGFAGRTGHDQFFTAFDRFGWTREYRRADMLADLMQTLAMQNTFYLEVMWMPQSGASRRAGTAVGWNEDFAAMDAALAPSLPDLLAAAIAETDAMEARARELLRCPPEDRPADIIGGHGLAGCSVTVRYLVQANRLVPPEQTYGQLALGAALIAADPRWVGLQLVAPEDHPNALANYDTHMAMFDWFTRRGVPASLHAGELTLAYATPLEMDDHVSGAVRAGARRIGHGIAIPHEVDAQGLVARMAEELIAVEVNLTSNDVILEVEGDDHPVIWLRQAGVPVVYTTDDPGISRIDLSHEYARAVTDTGATYADLVTSARNAIAFSFLPGENLWLDPGRYRSPHAACAADLGDGALSDRCEDFLQDSARAREQFRYERLLAEFEADWRGRD
ncbi:adenosine deaminase [Brevundimonas sp.]|uniref:adenosine deaminase n=1 Tax=Brevundimonas sp. TaxID=1871086 RepID=UPI0025D8F7D6|nr:adenosine deaminase [Brevundimonas sp.]